MAPKEKAEELINRMYYTQSSPTIWTQDKDCALIAVNEMLNEYPAQCPDSSFEMERHLFWQEVKQEIEKL